MGSAIDFASPLCELGPDMTATRTTKLPDPILTPERRERIDTLTAELDHAITEYQAEKHQLQRLADQPEEQPGS